MQTLSIRRAGLADAVAVARCVHALLEELSGGAPPAMETVLRDAACVLASDRVVAALACLDGTPVGVMTLNDCMAIYAGGSFGEISELYVDPRNRSQGVARHLLDFAVAQAQARGWHRLEVGAPAQPAWSRTLGFYLSNGFEEVGPRLRRLV